MAVLNERAGQSVQAVSAGPIRMANPFYSPDRHRAARVRELFTAIAPRYDLLNDIQSFGLHRLWKHRLVRLADLRAGELVLDICCGTGDIALVLAKAGMCVTGLDFSEPMLTVARGRAEALSQRRGRKSSFSPPKFVQGDAMHLPFDDDAFSAVTVGYGLRNLEDWKTGLQEMVRVARPGARILVLDFGKPDNPLLRSFYFGYLRLMVPVFGKVFCGNAAAYAYILESLRHYPAQRGVAETMQSLALAEVKVENLLGGMMSINHGVK